LQYSEKIKSGLIIRDRASGAIGLPEGRGNFPGKKVLHLVYGRSPEEIRIAENVLGSGHYSGLEGKVMEAIGRFRCPSSWRPSGLSLKPSLWLRRPVNPQ